MQKHKAPSIQLFFGLLFVFSAILVIRDTTHSSAIAPVEVAPIADEPISLPLFEDLPQPVASIDNSTVATPTNCRYGVSSWSNNDFNFLQDLGVGWALNFGVNFGQNLPDGVEYTPVIRFKPQLKNGNRTGNYRVMTQPFTDDPGGLGDIVRANPGRLWLIGNEVDRVDAQDDLMPDVYAKAYHDAYYFIKARDPSAQIAISGLVQVTPGRLQYLDIVWNSYLEKYKESMPVDVWNMHIYILAEKFPPDGRDAEAAIALGTDPAIAIWGSGLVASECAKGNVYCYAEHDDMGIFAQQVVAMRQWMKAHGQQNKPLILSEFSLLFPYEIDSPTSCFLMDEYGNCFTPERVSQFMTKSFDYLETASSTSLGFPADNHRLVQQWLWFTVNIEGSDFASDLLKDGYTLTNYTLRKPGERFKTEVNSLRPFSTNFFISEVSYPTATTITLPGTASATIAATIYNNGDTETTAPFTVTFFADAAKTNPIGTAVISEPLGGCARRTVEAQLLWTDLEPGLHYYWAEVEGGNTVKGFVIVNPEQVFLPIVER